jgi:hypothetical protein
MPPLLLLLLMLHHPYHTTDHAAQHDDAHVHGVMCYVADHTCQMMAAEISKSGCISDYFNTPAVI